MAMGMMIRQMASITSKYKLLFLISCLEKSLTEHKEEYLDAIVGYKQRCIEEINKYYSEVYEVNRDFSEGFNVPSGLGLVVPDDCTKSYTKLISIFKAMQTEEIELTLDDANHIINNDWDFIQSASVSNSAYLKKKG